MFWSKYRVLKFENNPEELWRHGDNEESDEIESECHRRTLGWLTALPTCPFWKAVIAGLALYGSVDLVRRTSSAIASKKRDNSCYCGATVAEALSNSCTYDLLASAWLPEYCRDSELTAEFDHAGPGHGGAWDYFADSNGSVLINATEVGYLADAEPGTLYWTTNEWHIVHCVYYWLKQYRSKDTGVVVEARYNTEKHIRHCGEMFLKYITEPYYIDTLQSAALDSS